MHNSSFARHFLSWRTVIAQGLWADSEKVGNPTYGLTELRYQRHVMSPCIDLCPGLDLRPRFNCTVVYDSEEPLLSRDSLFLALIVVLSPFFGICGWSFYVCSWFPSFAWRTWRDRQSSPKFFTARALLLELYDNLTSFLDPICAAGFRVSKEENQIQLLSSIPFSRPSHSSLRWAYARSEFVSETAFSSSSSLKKRS
ncbi:hypothetical protein C8J56DRAFT_122362 [Mycena floridula]|nr:hypothetical protein C8J56DRAFT_122362 [Mycena floridula]